METGGRSQPDLNGRSEAERARRADIDRIGTSLKAERDRRGWSLRRLAQEAGVSASLLSAVENGRIVPTVASLFAVSEAFGMPPDVFFPRNRRSVLLADEQVSPATTPGPDMATELPVPPDAAAKPALSHNATSDKTSSQDLTAKPNIRRAEPEAQGRDPFRPGRRLPQIRRRNVSTASGLGRKAEATETAASASSGSTGSTGLRPGLGGAVSPWMELKTITLPGGVVWWLLRDGSGREDAGSATLIEVVLPPGMSATPTATTHARRDQLVVLEGELRITLAFTAQVLAMGEVTRVDGSIPHRFENRSVVVVRFLVCVFGYWDGVL